MTSGWIGVDLDGTLAHYEGFGLGAIGRPIPAMADRVRNWLAQGIDVRIFTARATAGTEAIAQVQAWTLKHFGVRLPVTSCKDFALVELWDDNAVRVEMNTGRVIGGEP